MHPQLCHFLGDCEEETRLDVPWTCRKYLGPREIENNHNKIAVVDTSVRFHHSRILPFVG